MTQLEAPDQKSAGRPLSQLDEDERYRTFDDLQLSMPAVWESMQRGFADESVVVVPSISIERTTPGSGTIMQALEERALFLLLLLRQPRLRMIYVTSQPISEAIVEYYLGLLPGVIPSHARARLTLVPVGDASPVPLSTKLLARPRLLREIREMIPNPARSHLIPYNTTPLERDVALSLGLPMYGADPRLADLGSKTGCRRTFEELGVRCPVGAEDLHTLDDIVAGVQSMRVRRPSLSQVIVKLNEGVSGAGNAMVNLDGLPAPGSSEEASVIADRVRSMQPEAENLAVDVYLAAFEKHGGIVEERITGVALESPSVQMRALPGGTVELLSTHDQLLGGASGQKYLGCVFPANPAYAAAIAEPAMVIGRHLAKLGVLGRFAVDFVVVQDDSGAWTPYAIELNLRKGGTTHPFLTLQFLTDGTYDGERGVFLTPTGTPKYLIATDHFEDARLKALTVTELFDAVVDHGLHFDQARRTGVVFHMISCLTECGRVGLTAVGDSPDDAWRIYEEAQAVLLREAEVALEEGAVVGWVSVWQPTILSGTSPMDPTCLRRVSAATSPVDDRGAPAVPTWDVVTGRRRSETSGSVWPVASPLRASPGYGAGASPSTTLTPTAKWRRGHTYSLSDNSATWSPRKPRAQSAATWCWATVSPDGGQRRPVSTRQSCMWMT